MRTVTQTYEFKLYDSKKNKYLDEQIEIASEIWNFCVAMCRMYYKVYGKTLSVNKLKKYITKLKKRRKWQHWNKLGSQAIQDVVERIGRSYDAFFNHIKEHRRGRKSPPGFKKRTKYKSFTLKQAGYSFEPNSNVVIISGRKYKFWKSRSIDGTIKTVTIKRTRQGEYFLFVVIKKECNDVLPRAGKSVGMDFGLKHFLTLDDGTTINSPEWFKASLAEIRLAHRRLSRCKKGSHHRELAIRNLNKVYEKVSNRRRDWFFKLANYLVGEYAIICIEDLNLDAMKRLWGRKVSDLAFAEFIRILEWVASNAGTEVVKIDKWAASSKTCHICGEVNSGLTLKQRSWDCPRCGNHLDRDVNAAINIKRLGLAKLGYSAV